MSVHFQVAAITDEFSADLETAARAMAEIGIAGAELRVVDGKNILDLGDEELEAAIRTVRANGLEIVSIASPLLKCVLPDTPEIDARFQKDVFASAHTFADQPRLAARALDIARRTEARIIRVFSYWRTVEPKACFERVVTALRGLAETAAREGVVIGLENEQACNVATAEEAARVLAAVGHPGLKVVWDPANALVSGEDPFPEGYGWLDPGRIAHVHAKDCGFENGKLTWAALGDGVIDWRGQLAALRRDGYTGWISLETHWEGPAGDKLEASRICGRRLVAMA